MNFTPHHFLNQKSKSNYLSCLKSGAGFTKYYQAVRFLESLLNLPIKDYLLDRFDRSFYIERLRWLLKILGDPHKNFKFIHITGTAGKGTTANTLHEILTAAGSPRSRSSPRWRAGAAGSPRFGEAGGEAGKRVGSYFSPHPTTAIERIKVNRRLVAPAELVALVEKLKPFLKEAILKSPYGHPSYFETFLALAFLYFKQKKCEYVILEAGLGGRHDATNVIAQPLLCAITNINHDHLEVLGKSLKKIALDKAGIIKKGSVFLTTESRSSILKLFKKECQRLKVPFVPVAPEPNPNLALAKALAQKLGLSRQAIDLGVRRAKLPCRFEIMQKRPLVIIDGSHNPAKIKFLTERLKEVSFKKLVAIVGLAGDKDFKKSLPHLIPLCDQLIFTRFLMPYRKTADLEKMAAFSRTIRPNTKPLIFLDPYQALKAGLKLARPQDCLLICGSFFLAGELRTHWIKEEQILRKRSSF